MKMHYLPPKLGKTQHLL